MKQDLKISNCLDEDLNPAGGKAYGTGISIFWQDGPLGRGEDRQEPNGAFVEGVIQVALSRLRFYQASKFACVENMLAVQHLEAALGALEARTKAREEADKEGTHEV